MFCYIEAVDVDIKDESLATLNLEDTAKILKNNLNSDKKQGM